MKAISPTFLRGWMKWLNGRIKPRVVNYFLRIRRPVAYAEWLFWSSKIGISLRVDRLHNLHEFYLMNGCAFRCSLFLQDTDITMTIIHFLEDAVDNKESKVKFTFYEQWMNKESHTLANKVFFWFCVFSSHGGRIVSDCTVYSWACSGSLLGMDNRCYIYLCEVLFRVLVEQRFRHV